MRRCVAARDAGHADIPAVIEVTGQPDQFVRLRLDELYSPKDAIVRDRRYIRDTEYPTAVLGSEPPPISVAPIKTPAVLRVLTPVSKVRLL